MAIVTVNRIEVNANIKRKYLEDVFEYVVERERKSNSGNIYDFKLRESQSGKDIAKETNNDEVNVLL